MTVATPFNLLKQTATVGTVTESLESTGAPKLTVSYAGAPTVQCAFQPASSREALQMQRDTGVSLFDVYLAPNASSGSATSGLIAKSGRIKVADIEYRAVSECRDLCSEGAVLHLIVERFT